MQSLQRMKFDFSNLSGKQINTLLDESSESQLQSYINQINEIKNAENSNNSALFDSLQIQEYASALKDVKSAQAALLLSTQGLSNAQILETLTARGLTTEEKYQAMMDAGLLQSKQSLTNVELQNSIAKTLSASMSEEEAAAKSIEVMSSMGLSAAIEGEEAQTVQLTIGKASVQKLETKRKQHHTKKHDLML